MRGGSTDWGRKSKPSHLPNLSSSGTFLSGKWGYWAQGKCWTPAPRQNSYSVPLRPTQDRPPVSQALVNAVLPCHLAQQLSACRAGSPGLPATCESLPISGQRNDEKAINTKVLWAEWFSIHCILQKKKKKSQSHTLNLDKNSKWLKAILWKFQKLKGSMFSNKKMHGSLHR